MIKIDGEKIKELREHQGLTQLYMATAVEVTTDTISRWENKRYPTIKEENAQKLAETLGVSIEDILLPEEDSIVEDGPDLSTAPLAKPRYRKSAIILFVLIIGALISAVILDRIFLSGTKTLQAQAFRNMPPRAIPNSPFPVVIEVSPDSRESTSIILKEILPEGSRIVQISPTAGASNSDEEIKWIHKLQKPTRFSYLVEINGSTGSDYIFDGLLSTSKNEEALTVQGSNSITLGQFHWADIDGDNTISDQEILTVFDYYSDIDDFTIDIEFIEKMWLGSGYSWDRDKNLISITP